MKMPLRPGSVCLSKAGSTFMLNRDGLWVSQSSNTYAMTEDLPDGWVILYDAADMEEILAGYSHGSMELAL